MKDIKYIGVPDVCFSLTNKENYELWFFMLRETQILLI